MADIGIGSTIWYFDVNRRVYRKDPGTGRSFGGPIWREHWRQVTIDAENRVSWVTTRGNVNKKALAAGELAGWCASEEHINRCAWVNENKYEIMRIVQGLYDYETLRKVAEIVGYKPATEDRP